MATDPYIEVDSFIDVPIYTCTFPFNKRLHDGIIHRNFGKIIKAVLRREVGSLRKDFPAI